MRYITLSSSTKSIVVKRGLINGLGASIAEFHFCSYDVKGSCHHECPFHSRSRCFKMACS